MRNQAPLAQNIDSKFLDLENNLVRLANDRAAQKRFLFSYIKNNIYDLDHLKQLCDSFLSQVENYEEEQNYILLRNEIIIDYLLQIQDKERAANEFLDMVLVLRLVDIFDFTSIYEIIDTSKIEDYAAAICAEIFPDEYDRAEFLANNFKHWFKNRKLKILRYFISSIKDNNLVAGLARDARIQDLQSKLSNFNYLIFTFNRIPSGFEDLQPVLQNKQIAQCLKTEACLDIKENYFTQNNFDDVKKVPATSLFFFLTEIMQQDPQNFFSMLNDETRQQLMV